MYYFYKKIITMKKPDLLFILSHGRVGAINKKTGDIVWEVKLSQYVSNSMGLSIGQINVEGNKIFVGSTGILLCLDTKDGSLIWKNELKGWGYNFVSMANVSDEAAAAATLTAQTSAAVHS
jgi:outer membrane protein assembly factor BamB